ncbi:MAG: hypothetical protein OEZ58_09010 [Gammaproteobacteria bacterium]|nr:hypothetical protein [Gammaproteobacteria bacterium]
MKRLLPYGLILFCLSTPLSQTHAGSLEKYGGGGSYDSSQSLSPRDQKIAIAVQNIQQAKPELRARMIEGYRQRINRAKDKNDFASAAFYQDILTRAGYKN